MVARSRVVNVVNVPGKVFGVLEWVPVAAKEGAPIRFSVEA